MSGSIRSFCIQMRPAINGLWEVQREYVQFFSFLFISFIFSLLFLPGYRKELELCIENILTADLNCTAFAELLDNSLDEVYCHAFFITSNNNNKK